MNSTELLDQFVIEARECLEAIGSRLLEVERRPDDAALLNDLFRSVHTLKGNCGLFEFGALERVVHAGEDLLDRVRNGSLPYGSALADALLEAMDFSARLIDQIEASGGIDPAAEALSAEHARRLRALLAAPSDASASAPGAMVGPAEPGRAADEAPGWLARLDAELLAAHPGALAACYQPEAQCFFKGEDPWRLVCTCPGLVAVGAGGQQPWPTGEALAQWDCYECNLDLVFLSTAPRAEVEAHFRCVPEQLRWAVVAPPAPAAPPPPSPALGRARELWANQCAVLANPRAERGALLAARTVLRRLLPWLAAERVPELAEALDALPPAVAAAELLAWARRAVPPAAEPPDTALADTVAARADGAGAEPVMRSDDAAGSASHKVLKVGQEKVDRLMDLIGEMVVAKNSLPFLAQRAETVFQQRELSREIKAQYAVINRIAEDMQHAIMQVRMLPVGAVFQRFGRLVRDISRKLGKEVRLSVEGEETEADKNVIEALADPLIHILRNSLDHGIESPEARRAAGKPAAGTIAIKARQESDRVIIEIRDDGAGVNAARVRAKAVERGLIPADRAASLSDADAVQLIFLPGFSTADTISDLSGRGVGMDVVRTAVERVNGAVTLSSVQGQGTTIALSLPLSMAVTHVMVVESARRRFGVPMNMIVETVRVHADDIHHFKQARTTVLRGRIVALRSLNEVLGLDEPQRPNADGELAVLVVRVGAESVGVLVDDFHDASDIILKPLEGVLAGLTGFAGTALTGDGGVLMILNPKELLT